MNIVRLKAPFVLATALTFVLVSCQQPGGTTQPIAPPFDLETAITEVEIPQSGQVSLWVKLKRNEGFKEAVKLSFAGLPAGIQHSWSRDTGNGDGTLLLTVAEDVAPGVYELTLRGDAASSLSDTKTLSVKVIKPGKPTFTLSLQPAVLEAGRGGRVKVSVTINRLNFIDNRLTLFDDPVTLSLEGTGRGGSLPAGISGAFKPVVVSGNSAVLALDIASTVALGSYDLVVKGISGKLVKSASLSLEVVEVPVPTFSLELDSNFGDFDGIVEMSADTRKSIFISLSSENGFDEPVALSLEGGPAGVRGDFSTDTPTVPSNTLMSLFVDLLTEPGTYNLSVKAEGGGQVKLAPITLTVPDSNVSFSADTIGLNALDTTFGEAGIGFTFTSGVSARAAALQPDGRLVVAGNSTLTRYSADGVLEPGFGGDFFASDNIFIPARDVAFMPDGKIVVTGNESDANFGGFVRVARFLSDGSLDTSFADNGDFLLNGQESFGTTLVPLANGKLLVAGTVSRAPSAGFDFLLLRLTPGGNLDPDFGDNGKVTVDVGFTPAAIARDSQGRFVVVGRTQQGIGGLAIARLSSDGVLDTTFDGDGNATVDGDFHSAGDLGLTFDAQNRILLAATEAFSGFAVVRLTENGALDTSFDGDGKVVIAISGEDIAHGIAVQNDNKILVVGTTSNNVNSANFAATRLNADGSLDTGFGDGGKVAIGVDRTSNSGGVTLKAPERFFDVIVQADGRVVAVGQRDNTLALARFDP